VCEPLLCCLVLELQRAQGEETRSCEKINKERDASKCAFGSFYSGMRERERERERGFLRVTVGGRDGLECSGQTRPGFVCNPRQAIFLGLNKPSALARVPLCLIGPDRFSF
jgi:hypothetical protein